MSMFTWTAPFFKLASRRWSDEDFAFLAERLRPFVASNGVFADLGGGTGEISAGVAHKLGARVVIIDRTSQMLRRVSPDPLVSVRLAAAEAIPFPDGYFDALLCFDAFHHMRDQDAAAREIARVVRPGGAVLIFELEPIGGNRRWATIERFLGEPAGFHMAADLRDFLAVRGIEGQTTPQRDHNSYFFLGCVNPVP